ncbi:hypothetical protein TGCAST_359780, partial [Toxoplasma gondii CAST]
MLPTTVTTPRSPNCISRTEHSRVEHAGRMGGISTGRMSPLHQRHP